MRVILHLGAQKTGSSAIQVGLTRNREKLASLGCFYPPADNDKIALQGGITSGNGMALAAFLAPSASFASHFKKHDPIAELSCFAKMQKTEFILYSSELFMFAQRAPLKQLAATLQELSLQPQAIMYVRNLLDHANSFYNQIVKRHRYTRTFEHFVQNDYNPRFLAILQLFVEAFGHQNVKILSYDSNPKRTLGKSRRDHWHPPRRFASVRYSRNSEQVLEHPRTGCHEESQSDRSR